MSEQNIRKNQNAEEPRSRNTQPGDKKLPWETPKMEDVSEEVMAQPYIRFT